MCGTPLPRRLDAPGIERLLPVLKGQQGRAAHASSVCERQAPGARSPRLFGGEGHTSERLSIAEIDRGPAKTAAPRRGRRRRFRGSISAIERSLSDATAGYAGNPGQRRPALRGPIESESLQPFGLKRLGFNGGAGRGRPAPLQGAGGGRAAAAAETSAATANSAKRGREAIPFGFRNSVTTRSEAQRRADDPRSGVAVADGGRAKPKARRRARAPPEVFRNQGTALILQENEIEHCSIECFKLPLTFAKSGQGKSP